MTEVSDKMDGNEDDTIDENINYIGANFSSNSSNHG